MGRNGWGHGYYLPLISATVMQKRGKNEESFTFNLT